MKKVSLSIVTAFVFFLAMAYAQDTTGNQGSAGSSGTEQSSPSMSQGTGSTGSQGSMGSENGSMKHEKGMKGEKTLKGCVKSEGGQYMLQEKSGKSVNLSGSDVSAHVGHEVKVTGMYASGSSGSAAASSGSMSSGKTFDVTNVTMVSDSCTMGKKSKGSMSGGMGNSGSSTQPPQ